MDTLTRLRRFIDTQEILCRTIGLCGNFCIVAFNFKGWEHYSGDWLHPVPSSDPTLSPREFYLKREGLYEGEQLAYRLSLAKYLIEVLEREE